MTLIQDTERSLRIHGITGLALTAILFGCFGGWAATTHFSGAVVAAGSLVVDSSVQKVQHPTGGVVRTLLVRDGQSVLEGDLLARMDDTQIRANLAIVSKSLAELIARQARLEAERDDLAEPDFSQLVETGMPVEEASNLRRGELRLFELRRSSRAGQKAQLQERTNQLQQEIHGIAGQVAAKAAELRLIQDELVAVRELWTKKLIGMQRVTQVERDAARIDGQRNALISAMAQSRGKIAEIELQILQIDQDLRGEVAGELREIQGKIGELHERKVAAEDLLQKIDLKAPKSGRVHQLAVHTIGGVVNPAEAIMLIVPDNDVLTVEARLPPEKIDQVRRGMKAIIRLLAADQRTTPEIGGEVTLVSADITQDVKTGSSYYTVRVALNDGELRRLKDVKLVPGMPVETFIQTGERTVLSYLVKPLSDQVARTFRER